MKRILVAGVGNIFHGDDGFGCVVASQLRKMRLPAGVTVMDFGVRAYDLAYALTEGYDEVILVDALPMGKEAGTVSLIEPEPGEFEPANFNSMDGHSMNVAAALQMARSFSVVHGRLPGRIYLVGCEPEQFGSDYGEISLGQVVGEAVPDAVEMVRSLIKELTQKAAGK